MSILELQKKERRKEKKKKRKREKKNMVFSSLFFLFAFLPMVLLGYYGILRKQEHRNLFLLASSLFFYGWGEPVYIVLMLGSIGVNYVVGRLLGLCLERECEATITKQAAASDEVAQQTAVATRSKKSLTFVVLWVGIILNLLPLLTLKYQGFVVETLLKIPQLDFLQLRAVSHSLPIGISFFTFQALSYLVDVYRKEVAVQKNPFHLGLYISLFPQLVAGPIVRYSTIEHQMEQRSTSPEQFTEGVERFILGFAKKVLIANQLATISSAAFGALDPTVVFAWMGAIAYTLQIYYDFSGYSDMAIGLGRMFGFTFLENFNNPYRATSVTDFWRRWHMSLSAWFRDYVYIPLGGSRVGKVRLIINLFIVWMLTGLWHGAAYQFIAWGLIYFVLLSFEKLTGLPEKLKATWQKVVYQGFTLVSVTVAWVIFGEDGLKKALHHLFAMSGIQTLGASQVFFDEVALRYLSDYGYLFVIALFLISPLWDRGRDKVSLWVETTEEKWKQQLNENVVKSVEKWDKTANNSPIYIYIYRILQSLGYLFLLILSVSYLAMGAHNPFLYFNF